MSVAEWRYVCPCGEVVSTVVAPIAEEPQGEATRLGESFACGGCRRVWADEHGVYIQPQRVPFTQAALEEIERAYADLIAELRAESKAFVPVCARCAAGAHADCEAIRGAVLASCCCHRAEK